jgi:TPR repeat protein/serine/threonine protein kinase
MSPELHQLVRKLFHEALERPGAERLAFLQAACDGRPEVFEAVSSLLAAHVESDTFLEPTPPKPQFPKHIGRYVVSGELGRGAMGIVYEATDPLIGRTVAVKTIHLQSDASGGADFLNDRLFREARSAGRLSHPGVVTIFDVGREGDTAFIAMERVEGKSLQEILVSGRKLTIPETLDILRQSAAALDYAHSCGVVHRDIKPANIMLHKTATVKIADFGIAKMDTTQTQTATGWVMGTPRYMSPEQIGQKPLDGRSDQFALAVVAYELLTGACPFQAESLGSLVHMIMFGDRPSARLANPALPAAVDEALLRGLAKLPAERFASCVEFVTALEAAFPKDVPPLPVPPLPVPPLPDRVPSRSTNPLPYLLATGAVLFVVTVVLIYRFVIARPPTNKPAQAVAMPMATPVVVNQGVGKAPPTGAVEAPPLPPKTSELKATRAGGTISAKKTATPPPAPQELPGKNEAGGSRATDLYMEATVKKLARQPTEALALFRQSASLGEPRAMAEIGKLYLAGQGVGKDTKEAVTWFRKAAEAGNPSGMVFLASMYGQGSGVARDDGEAVRWFRKAAEAGDRIGMDGLGQVYANGRGLPKDGGEAVRWFGKAADAGNPSGMYHLGAMYEKGYGVEKDLTKAIEWYQKAAGLGSREAQASLAKLDGQPPRGAPPGAKVHVGVVGNQTWTDTGIDVNQGDTVHVGAAGSVALAADRRVPPQSPDGFSPDCATAATSYGRDSVSYPAPQLPCWSLIGRIGTNGPIFEVGAKRVFNAGAPGRLFFGINDNKVQGNSGIWTALVVVQPARTPER